MFKIRLKVPMILKGQDGKILRSLNIGDELDATCAEFHFVTEIGGVNFDDAEVV